MPSCAICHRSIEEAPLTDPETGAECHPRCVVERVPQDAVVRLLGVVALVVLSTVVIWAA